MAPRTRTLRAGLFKPWVRRKNIWKKSICFTFIMITVVVVGMLEFVKILLAKKNKFSSSFWSQWLLGWCYGGRLISGPRRSQYPGLTGDHQLNTNKPKIGPKSCARCALLTCLCLCLCLKVLLRQYEALSYDMWHNLENMNEWLNLFMRVYIEKYGLMLP